MHVRVVVQRWVCIFFLCSAAMNAAAQGTTTYTLISDKLVSKAAFVGIRIDNVETPDCGSAANHCTSPQGNHIKLSYDVTALVAAGNDVTIEARSCDVTGICGPWSAPKVFAWSGPTPPKNLRVNVKVVVSVTQ